MTFRDPNPRKGSPGQAASMFMWFPLLSVVPQANSPGIMQIYLKQIAFLG